MAPLMKANTAEAWLGLEKVARAVTFLLPCVSGIQSHPFQYNWTPLFPLPSSAICCPMACCRLKQDGIVVEATVMFKVIPVLPAMFEDGDEIGEGEPLGNG